ncbi:PilZ domain-containing protein [Candidatus Methylobacter oryzae]|uniref:PilZ domain-containing protein n=1 Tax=Candidatus Methylobacter oryzae TaxID=2497749 RepID=A0ABY3CCA1_9GAMM|nr:PilZ domain-containing protein [Candidatus Methylobacter oryzae]TRW98515.1 PilZ domain-containing protein [Candidatus Methylobacter oryzae]
MSKENRSATRYKVIGNIEFDTGTGITTTKTTTGVSVTKDIEFIYGVGDICNISTGGICFITKTDLELDLMLRCSISIYKKENKRLNLRCEGKIIRLDKLEAGGWNVALSLKTLEW